MTQGADQRAGQAHASGPVQRASRQRGRARRGAALTQASAGTQDDTDVRAEAGAQPGTRVRRRPGATMASSPRSESASEVPVAEQARRSRIAQGLPPTIQDPATLAYIARLLLPTIGKPRRSR